MKIVKPLTYKSRYGHGGKQLTLAPDGAIWVVVGNDVGLIDGTSSESPYRDPRDDHLLPYARDAVDEVRLSAFDLNITQTAQKEEGDEEKDEGS